MKDLQTRLSRIKMVLEHSPSSNAVERGRRNDLEGKAFEYRVAEIYRLMGYDVTHGRIFSGRQVDLFLNLQMGDLPIIRAIECKSGPVRTEHIDDFLNKLRLVRYEYPAVQGTIITDATFTDAVEAHGAREGIQLTTYRDLTAKLFNGHAYAQGLLREVAGDTRYQRELYVEPRIGYESSGPALPAFDVISEWLDTPGWNQLTLLGDVGTGKSFLTRMVAARLAESFLKNPLRNPLPILVDLRNADRQFSLEGLMLTHFARNDLARVSFDVFMYSLEQGSIILILDGFDEMAARVTPQVTQRNFHELARCVRGSSKVLLTCRTHYFKSRSEEEDVILGGSDDYESETARELYWELISRKGFRIAYLRPFSLSEIEEYVKKVRGERYREALQKIRNTYNLIELSQRPMLLEMIVKSIDKLDAPEINAATLYRIFTDAWVHRDQWRDVMKPGEKLSLVTGLARSLWDQDAIAIHYSHLTEYVQRELAAQIQDPLHLLEIDAEVRTASFLTRDERGNYGFAHKSYAEYFLARYLADRLNGNETEALNTRRFSPEVFDFLRFMVNREDVELCLETILTEEYTPSVSENALLCLYRFRRGDYLDEYSAAELTPQLRIVLPVAMHLDGAQLDQVVLEGAVMTSAFLEGATLIQSTLAHADLSNATLDGANLEKINAPSSHFTAASMRECNVRSANLEHSDLAHADLSGSDFSDAFLHSARYDQAILSDTIWVGAVLPEGSETQKAEFWAAMETARPWIVRMARSMGLSRDSSSEEMFSELAIQLSDPRRMDKFVTLQGKERRAYIYQVLTSMEERLRRERMREANPQLITDALNEVAVQSYLDSEAAVVEFDVERLLTTLELLLAPTTFEIFRERFLLGRTVQEIADVRKLSPRTVHRHLTKARELAKEWYIA